MSKTIAVINQKGGVGKSTTAQAIGAGLMLRGYSVLFVDLDAQGNLSYSMGADTKGYNALGVLERPETIRGEIQHTENGDILASSPKLAGADKLIEDTGKEYRLREALESLQGSYDYVIVDTPPALGVLTVNALTACTGAIVPTQADIFSLQGIAQLSGTIETIKRYCNPGLTIMGLVITRYNGRATIRREIAETLERVAGQLHTKLYQTKIRECISLVEAQTKRQPIFRYASRSNASKDYKALVEEILKGE